MTASAMIFEDHRGGWRMTLTVAGHDYWPKDRHQSVDEANVWARKWAADRRVDDFTIRRIGEPA